MQALQTYTDVAKKDDGEHAPAGKEDDCPGRHVPRRSAAHATAAAAWATCRLTPMFPRMATIYDAALVDAVKTFQRRHGRDPNGRIGAQTLADLNVPLSRRVQQMQLALERWRWMPESYQRAPIIVNIPEFRLRAYDKDFNVAVTMNVVVGNSFGHDTPVFADDDGAGGFSALLGGSALHRSIGTDSAHPKGPELPDEEGLRDRGQPPKSWLAKAGGRDSVSQLRAGKLFIRQIPGPKQLARPRAISLSQQLQHIHARYSCARVLREVAARFQPRLYPTGKARRARRMGAARQSRLEPGAHSRRHER